MKHRILIAFFFVFYGATSSRGTFSTQKPNATLITSTVATTSASPTPTVTESKADPVGNSPVTSPPPTTTTSASFNAVNTTTDVPETQTHPEEKGI